MTDQIINRVAKSPLITIDLEENYPQANRIGFDLKDWLYQGLMLKEKEFRAALNAHHWEDYQDSCVYIFCSTNAILPAWTYLLVATKLNPIVKKSVIGTLEDLDNLLYAEWIQQLDTTPYQNKKIIIKGCANKPIPQNAYLMLIQKLQPIANSIMYGEACSTVPLYKAQKKS